MICQRCSNEMIIFRTETPCLFSWGGYRLWGCPKCGNVFYDFTNEDHPDNPCKKPNDEIADISKYHWSN